MRRGMRFFLGTALVSCLSVHAGPLNTANLQAHVAFLSSDALGGRLAGSQGEKLAARYAADYFQQMGLEPAGDNGGYFQDFAFPAGAVLGGANSLTVTSHTGVTRSFRLNQEWRPLSFSDNQALHSAVVFAGYGIIAPASGSLPAYDSYRDLDVTDKWVMVFRYLPEKVSDEQRRHLARYASLRYKAFIAREHGAKGIIFVSGPNASVRNELIPLTLDASVARTGIAAISVTDKTASQLIPGYSLQQWQDALDAGRMRVPHQAADTTVSAHIDIRRKVQHGRNVLAMLRASSAAAPIIIIGAHADHLGRGEISGSRRRDNDADPVHHGADDNASGVAVVLEAAARLSALRAKSGISGGKNILFAIWSGEELGLLGSGHYIRAFTASHKTLRPAVDAYINLDMVGRLKERLLLQGAGSSPDWPRLIQRANHAAVMPVLIQNDPYLPTDSTAFYLHAVPTLNLFTGSHDEYHTPRDTLSLLNFSGMLKITQFLVDLALTLETEPGLPAYQKAKAAGESGRGFRVYLGTIPDYASPDISGVKLSGVTKDSPAERAGLRQNDVIIGLAGKTVRDIYGYTYILNSLRIGMRVDVTVQRGEKRVNLKIVAQSRE